MCISSLPMFSIDPIYPFLSMLSHNELNTRVGPPFLLFLCLSGAPHFGWLWLSTAPYTREGGEEGPEHFGLLFSFCLFSMASTLSQHSTYPTFIGTVNLGLSVWDINGYWNLPGPGWKWSHCFHLTQTLLCITFPRCLWKTPITVSH